MNTRPKPPLKFRSGGPLADYLRDFATLAPDPLAPEIQAYNTGRLNDLWKLSCQYAGQMTAVPYWGIVWPGGRALARYILDHPAEFAGRRILDVGCGSGIATLAAALVGARPTGMDIDRTAVALAGQTARANNIACDWLVGDALALPNQSLRRYDLIIAGDIFYEEKFARRALAFLRRAIKLGLNNVLADPGRTHRPAPQEIEVLSEMQVPVLPDIEGIRERTTTILRLI